MDGKRKACILIPNFPLWAHPGYSPRDHSIPVVVAEHDGQKSRIVALNHESMNHDISDEMTVVQAQSRCPGMTILIRNIDAEREISDHILSSLQSVGPFVHDKASGIFFLDLTGLQRLHGCEQTIATIIFNKLKSSGYPIHIGIAANAILAHIAANCSDPGETVIIRPGDEQRFLKVLQVENLMLSDGVLDNLHSLGIHTIGELAEFPKHEITSRFGEKCLALATYARGEDPSSFVPEILTEIPTEIVNLDYPIYTASLLLGHLDESLRGMLTALLSMGAGVCSLTLIFYCENKSFQQLEIVLDKPTSSYSLLRRQLSLKLEQFTIESGITDVLISLPNTAPVNCDQLDFDRHRTVSPFRDKGFDRDLNGRQLYVIEKLSRILPEEMFSYELAEQTSGIKQGLTNTSTGNFSTHYSLRSIAGLRLLRKPQSINITTKQGRLLNLVENGFRRDVLNQSGPWRLSGGWWNGGFDRYYYEVEISPGRVLLVFFDADSHSWFIQGVFD